MDKVSFVHTISKACMGCNKCIFQCPTHANEAFFEADAGKVFIRDGFCISCGECLSICDHGARDYDDDLDVFLKDLQNGESISVVIAPAATFNFDDLKRVMGYLKAIGVQHIYDVSFGADICTWGHVRLLQQGNVSSMIAQPCPVIVSYIEKYQPDLIHRLSPVQSPVICLATYLKQYLGIEEKLAFLSPCIGKKRECTSEHTHGVLDYNVTFTKFIRHLEQQAVDLTRYAPVSFETPPGSLGFSFPKPGGLSENIRYHLDRSVWIKQVEGVHKVKRYLKEYEEDLAQGKQVPTIIDVLNCEDGCNLGTGSLKTARHNVVDHTLYQNRLNLEKKDCAALFSFFDEKFFLSDFLRTYTDRSTDYCRSDDVDMESAFLSLGKFTKEDREINCFCCGYGNCHDFVYDLATGHNDKNNCRHYLLGKFKKMSALDDLTGLKNRYSYTLKREALMQAHPGFVGIAFIDINGLKQANDCFGHAYGDALIIRCATLLREVFGEGVYRIGGDEFIILADDVSPDRFGEMIDTLKEKVKREETLVVSIGTAVSGDETDLEEKIAEADQAMYDAKQAYYRTVARANRRS